MTLTFTVAEQLVLDAIAQLPPTPRREFVLRLVSDLDDGDVRQVRAHCDRLVGPADDVDG